MQTYAVYWNDASGARCAGRISLHGAFAELEGTSGGRRMRQRIGFEQIASVRYHRGRLHIWRRNDVPLRLSSVDRPGALRELGERLQSRRLAA